MRSTAFSTTLSGKTSVQKFACGRFFDTANPASMLIIFFISQFFAGQLYFIGVNNNNVIATIQIRREIRLMLAAQQFCDLSGQTAQLRRQLRQQRTIFL